MIFLMVSAALQPGEDHFHRVLFAVVFLLTTCSNKLASAGLRRVGLGANGLLEQTESWTGTSGSDNISGRPGTRTAICPRDGALLLLAGVSDLSRPHRGC